MHFTPMYGILNLFTTYFNLDMFQNQIIDFIIFVHFHLNF